MNEALKPIVVDLYRDKPSSVRRLRKAITCLMELEGDEDGIHINSSWTNPSGDDFDPAINQIVERFFDDQSLDKKRDSVEEDAQASLGILTEFLRKKGFRLVFMEKTK